jgi:hypothetical protein
VRFLNGGVELSVAGICALRVHLVHFHAACFLAQTRAVCGAVSLPRCASVGSMYVEVKQPLESARSTNHPSVSSKTIQLFQNVETALSQIVQVNLPTTTTLCAAAPPRA